MTAGPPEGDATALPAEFGLGTPTFVVIASMVGVGVLTTSGYTVAAVGSNQAMLWLWAVGGLAALCGALTLAELGAALPGAGGEYVILLEAYGPLAAFLWGWVTCTLGFAAPIAASASASASYLLAPFDLAGPRAQLAQQALASATVLLFAAIHTSARSRTAAVQGTITVVKLGLLIAFVVAGLAAGWRRAGNLADRPPLDRPTVMAMMFSLVYISYAYLGWNAAAYLAGEIRDPARRLPRALLLGTGGVVLLYLGLNIVYALALPAVEVRSLAKTGPDAVKAIAQLAAARLFGRRAAGPLSIAVGLMLLSSLSAYVLTGPRVAYAMARSGHFPAIAGRLSRRFRTPAVATSYLVVLALVLLWTGSFDDILTFASVGMAIFSLLTISSVYVLRRRRPDLPRPFLTPGYPVVPAVYLVVSSLLALAAFLERPWLATTSLLGIMAGIPVYYAWNALRRPKLPDDQDG